METNENVMKLLNTFGVQFLIRQDKLKDGKTPVYARIRVNRDIIHFALKRYPDLQQGLLLCE
jgi:hypothetical protein